MDEVTYRLPGIVLRDSRYCDGCPALDTMSYGDSYCTAGEFHMRSENIGSDSAGFGTWRTIRPKGCRLVQEDAEQDAAHELRQRAEKAEAEIERLRMDNGTLRGELCRIDDVWEKAERTATLISEVERLREALKLASDHIQHVRGFDKPCLACAINKALEETNERP